MTPAVSIIIPLSANETLWRQLLPLLPLADEDELIIAAGEPAPADWLATPHRQWRQCDAGGRAAQMNAAAAAARNDFLWFVHADSRPPAEALPLLKTALAHSPTALHYFRLRFYDGGSKMRLNEWGVRLRCHLFKNPFGDQALCLSAALFNQLGGYDENAAYGEDHLLVLRARRSGVAILPVAAAVATSARRYMTRGWWNTVCRYQYLWWRQWRQH